jgi:hypothetical protein
MVADPCNPSSLLGFWKMRQDDHEFKANLGYTVRLSQNKTEQKDTMLKKNYGMGKNMFKTYLIKDSYLEYIKNSKTH